MSDVITTPNTHRYTEVIENRDKAVCLRINDMPVWVAKDGLIAVNGVATHWALDRAIQDAVTFASRATADTKMHPLGPIAWDDPDHATVAYDVSFVLTGGEVGMSTTKVRVFVPRSVLTPGHEVAEWRIIERLKDTLPQVFLDLPYTVRNYNDDVLFTEVQHATLKAATKPSTVQTAPAHEEIPFDVPAQPRTISLDVAPEATEHAINVTLDDLKIRFAKAQAEADALEEEALQSDDETVLAQAIAAQTTASDLADQIELVAT
jgi:hypothetical protein